MKMSLWETALLGVLALVLGVVLPDARTQQPPAKSEPAPQQPSRAQPSAPQIFRQVKPSVALILAGDQREQSLVQGSGFIVGQDRVVTNHHVVAGTSQAYVLFSDGAMVEVSGVAADSPNKDLVVLAVPTGNRQAARMGDEMALREGDAVYALGAPEGLQLSFTNGIVSSFRNLGDKFVIQSTAPIAHGSSGGPLLDQRGLVVGITTEMLSEAPGIYFSVGVGELQRLLREPVLVVVPFSQWAKNTARAQQPPAKSEPAPQQQPSQQAPKPPATPGQAAPAPRPEAPKINPEEDAAYKAFLQVKRDDSQNMIRLGEEFLKKYPNSAMRETVYWFLTTAYQATGQDAKMFAAGEKVLEIDPNNVDALSLMAWAMPRRIQPGDLDADQKLQKAASYAKHAIELLATLQKPPNVTDEAFARAKNEELVSCHSGLGLVYYYQQQYPEMTKEFEQAAQLTPNPDPVDVYFLGVGYEQTKRYADAVTAFTQCSQMPGPMQGRCKTGLEQAKKLAGSQPAPAKP